MLVLTQSRLIIWANRSLKSGILTDRMFSDSLLVFSGFSKLADVQPIHLFTSYLALIAP